MGKVCVACLALGALAIVGFSGPLAPAQNFPSPASESTVVSGIPSDCGCDDPGYCGRAACSRLGCWQTRYAAYGYEACNCRGSYKFPVPPQYTYHWPGMYSQQWMTEYNSPYRFPPLEIPEEYSQAGPGGPLPRAEPAAASTTRTGSAHNRSLSNGRWNAKRTVK